MAEERGFKVDLAGYEAAKAAAIERSQVDTKASEEQVNLDVHALSELKLQGVPETDERFAYSYSCLTFVTAVQPQVQLPARG
jgi:alanyl-tRNA synthetase